MRFITLLSAAFFAALLTTPSSAISGVIEVDEPAICYQCHAEMETIPAGHNAHAPFEAGECSSCHNPHASKHAGLLASDSKVLCLTCHEDLKSQGENLSPHIYATENSCQSCHNPHSSSHENILLDTQDNLCQGCHKQVASWIEQDVVHAPVEEGECSSCHDPHAPGGSKLLTDQLPQLCFNCHEADQDFITVHNAKGIENSNCTACHNPHASSMPSLVRANQHAPFKKGNCGICHETGGEPFAIKGTIRDLCLKCHGKIKGNATLAHSHNLNDESSCTNCHNPHASNTDFMLVSQQEILCMSCHFNPPEFKKAKEEYITHPGVVCSSCHLPHGADNEKLLIDQSVDLCNSCHVDAHKASHPVGKDIIDPRTDETMNCLSCHKLHGSNYPKYLPLNPSMDLCIQCHQK